MASGKAKAWIQAMRLRTLPLAIASIILGSFLAAAKGFFDPWICTLSIVTTLLLQILSNLSNDYGDTIHGVDSQHREGPSRTVQSGLITTGEMLKAMYLTGFLAFMAGLALIWIAFAKQPVLLIVFLLLGLLAIYAAVRYTSGKNPYGYRGLGDVYVLLFFGLVGVKGSYFLYTSSFDWTILLPAASCGLFAVAVLNINNIRDIKSDQLSGKNSIPVRLGRRKAILYHWAILATGLVCAILYVMLQNSATLHWLFLITLPLLFLNGKAVSTKEKPAELDPYLKQMALTTLLFVLTFGLGQVLG